MPPIELSAIEFSEPQYLRVLVIPALLLALWVWWLVSRQADTYGLRRTRLVPVRERFGTVGDLPFWLCLVSAIACVTVALARPRGPAQALTFGGIDMVILADASASMRVRDVPGGDRWQRAMRFARLLGDSLDWKDDRVALTIFARIAAPQVRLTRDPNTFFFFLDHLSQAPPFRIGDNTTWDTNLELGISWGLRLIERDERLHGRSSSAKMFVLLSDGQAWSGETDTSLRLAARRQIPIFTVGVGTLSGGRLPLVPQRDVRSASSPSPPDRGGPVDTPVEQPLTSRLDRGSLQSIADATGGQYFELDRDGDRRIAHAIVDAGRRLAPALGAKETAEELYWWFLIAAAAFVLLGIVFIRDRAELALQLAGTVVIFVVISRLIE